MESDFKTILKQHKDKIVGGIFYLMAIYYLIRGIILAFSVDIWYDELFSIEFAKRTVSELVGLTARDVHPPLYYILLRGMYLLLGGTGLPIETIAKLTSCIPFAILIIYSLTYIRKNFGFIASGIFSFAILTMPQMPEYTTEIRMYSFAVLFVTAALLHGFGLMKSMTDAGNTKWDIKNSLGLFLFGVAAFYSHYYAGMSVGIIYFLLIVWMVLFYLKAMKEHIKINFKVLASVVIAMNLTVIAYVPWLFALSKQISTVKNNYWIQPVGLRSFLSAAKYIFTPYYTEKSMQMFAAVMMIIFTVALAAWTFFKGWDDKLTKHQCIMAFLVLPLLILGGLVASWLIRPVFVNRYMIPAFGCFWLSIAIMIGKALEQKRDTLVKRAIISVALVMTIYMASIGITDYRAFIGNEEYREVNMTETLKLFRSIDDDTIIISNFDQAQALMAYYLNDDQTDNHKVYLYLNSPEALINETVSGLATIEDPVDVYNFVDSGKRVLFLGSFNSREVILQEWNDAYGITFENKGSFLMERYWFDVFELSLE
ncbi:glycosyltransferase family 39 protein [Butyrivibrio proteoclasticus]|uniref:glycosyltransferase family 39 protein n=1 Tax=Butyrivibrio proteoclasticus TaxID=43305 RepID=UPI00047C30FB|nr:hypothetical protein [Butyrivibrio proteoclasticus]